MEIKKDFAVELASYIYDSFIKENGISEIATLFTGVSTGDDVNVFATGSFTEVGDAGCNPEFKDADVASGKKWTLGSYGTYRKWCEDKLEKELLRNQKLYDLTENEAFMQYVGEYLEQAFNESLVARTLFQSSGSSDYVTAGLSGTSDGLLIQGEKLIANGDADASQHVNIATNTKAGLRNGTTAIDVLYDVIDGFSADLQEDGYIMVNQKFYSDLAYCMRMNGNKWNETQYTEMKGGYKAYDFDGYKLIVNPYIDRILEQLQSGDKFYGKRAVIFASNVPSIGVATRESEDTTFKSDVWFSKDDNDVKAKVEFNTGAVIAVNRNWVSAY